MKITAVGIDNKPTLADLPKGAVFGINQKIYIKGFSAGVGGEVHVTKLDDGARNQYHMSAKVTWYPDATCSLKG